MKPSYLLICACLVYLFTACKPDFDLNAPYKDVTVVYGILDHQDSIHYIKIYKGYQSHKQGGVFIDAQNPDSIYYYNQISVVLQEYEKDKRTSRKDIPLYITHDFPRDSGFFYYDKERIIYYTKESLSKNYSYKIVIKHNSTGKVTEGMTQMLGNGVGYNNFAISLPSSIFIMLGTLSTDGTVNFYPAQYAFDYEFHVNFLYFEVDNNTKKVTTHRIVKNICPKVGVSIPFNEAGYFSKNFAKTFYEDIAEQVKPNPNVTRYIGTPGSNGSCIEIEGWAAGESMVNFLLSNQPTSSFAQINTIYTNLTSSEGLAFGFLSSKVKCPTRIFATNQASEDTLVKGPKTGHLGFKYWTEYKP